MRRILVAFALGIGLLSGAAQAAPVIGAAPAMPMAASLADPVTPVQYRHHGHHRPHYRHHHHHRRHYAPPPRHYRHHGHRPHYRPYGYRPAPPRYYGWR